MASFDKTSHPGGQTQSVWQGTFSVSEFPPLESSITTDVCIIGAGIAGLTTAYLLAKAGKHVVVVDDGPIGGGETGRTTAHLSNAMDEGIHRLEKLHGAVRTRYVVESHTSAIHRIEMIVKEEKIDCDFRRLDGYLFAAKGTGDDELQTELLAAHRAGLVDVRLIDRAPIAGFDTGPALRFPEQAQLHALQYVAGLATAIQSMGGDIYCGSHVSAVKGGSPCTVTLENKQTITADAVCVCTNASITDYLQTHAKQAPYRTYAVGLPVPRGTVDSSLFWDTADPYHYARLQSLSAASTSFAKGETLFDLLIVGGEDHKTAHADDADKRWSALEQWARERWPQAGDVMYKWSGQVLEPNDYLAFIGANPDGAKNVYMASGDSGQGMTHGTIAGMLLTDLILGRQNPWTEVYDPRRVTIGVSSVEHLVKENVDVATQYVKDILSPGAKEDEIPRGEGRVLGRGTHKIAAYRDDAGAMHYCSAVCTHLKCIVGWNSAEKTWDCPCHGSRFDPVGAVINGPAIENLEKAEGP